mmetsp:Transcript_27462/g.47406  ORF Transcript_27462/g.47406 Transcript_27462/m.47406 type:complete len:345 (+) Transcript_27462:427-1461(+)
MEALVLDTVGPGLELVVDESGKLVVRLGDLVDHELGRPALVQLWAEAAAEVLQAHLRARTVPRQAAVLHQVRQRHKSLHVLPAGEIRPDAQVHEVAKVLGVRATAHDLDHLLGELERSALKPEVAPRRDVEDEPEVDVYDVAIFIDEDVAVVAVLDLQDEADHRVGGHGQDEVAPRPLEIDGVLVAILLEKVLVQGALGHLAQHVAALRPRHHLDDAAAWSGGDDAVGEEVEVLQAAGGEDVLEEADELQRQAVLTAVVPHLEDAGLGLDGGQGVGDADAVGGDADGPLAGEAQALVQWVLRCPIAILGRASRGEGSGAVEGGAVSDVERDQDGNLGSALHGAR